MITPQQLRVITLLSQGKTITEAAELEKIHRNTIANWRRTTPAFATELDAALQEQRQYWQDQATRLAPLAIQAIEDCLTNPKSSPSLRFRAATYILKMATTKTPPLHKSAQPEESASLDPRPSAQSAAEELGSFIPPESQPSKIENPAQSCTRPHPGRNTQCPCGSQLKYKRCCISKAA